jgi:hypothetical protein
VVLEQAVPDVEPGREAEFEAAFADAKAIIASSGSRITPNRLSSTLRRSQALEQERPDVGRPRSEAAGFGIRE